MTPDEINALVAEKIMGWHPSTDKRLRGDGWWSRGTEHTCELPDYYTDVSAAFEVQAEMERRGYWMRLESPTLPGHPWVCRFSSPTNNHVQESSGTHAAAICLAALRALGVET